MQPSPGTVKTPSKKACLNVESFFKDLSSISLRISLQ